MASYLRDLTELTTVATNDYLLISDTSDVTNKDKRISQANLLATAVSGGGTLATGGFTLTMQSSGTLNLAGFTLTLPASGVVAMRFGTATAGRVTSWYDGNFVQDGGFAVSDIARLSVAQSFTGKVTAPAGFNSSTQNISTDTVLDIPLTVNGMIFVYLTGGFGVTNRFLIGTFRPNASPLMQSMVMGTDFNVTTGTLTGTTGTAGKVTVAAANGHVYIENRLGSLQTFSVTLFT